MGNCLSYDTYTKMVFLLAEAHVFMENVSKFTFGKSMGSCGKCHVPIKNTT